MANHMMFNGKRYNLEGRVGSKLEAESIRRKLNYKGYFVRVTKLPKSAGFKRWAIWSRKK